MKSKILLFLACGISGMVYGKSEFLETPSAAQNVAKTTIVSNKARLLPPPSEWTVVEDTDPGWTWTLFEEDGCDDCSGGSAYSYEFDGATAEYTFTGTDLEVYCETYDAGGSIEIFIDGVSKGVFTQKVEPYGGGMKFAEVTGLTPGVHQLKMVSVPELETGYVSWVGIDFIQFGTTVVTPLDLTSFTAKLVNNASKLTWTSENEVGVDKFLVERSSDGIIYTILTEVLTKGGGTYSYSDPNPLNGINYYRLQMIDSDGSSVKSKIVSLKASIDGMSDVSVYPNPSKDVITISPSTSKPVSLAIFDNLGRIVLTKQIVGITSLSVASLAKGAYIIQLTGGGEVKVTKFIKD